MLPRRPKAARRARRARGAVLMACLLLAWPAAMVPVDAGSAPVRLMLTPAPAQQALFFLISVLAARTRRDA